MGSLKNVTAVETGATPNLKKEEIWSIFKCMFVLCMVLCLGLCGLFGYYVHKSFSGTTASMEVMQDGTNNNQSVTNG